MKPIQIGTIPVGPGHKPFIIAEMSGNHNQSLKRALAIVDAAAEAGAHAIKLQTYTPDTMTMVGALTIVGPDYPQVFFGKSFARLNILRYVDGSFKQAAFIFGLLHPVLDMAQS